MNSDYLRTFVEVARHRSYAKAARALGTSQPTAFRHVRLLEERLAVELVTGAGKTVLLTNRGKAVLDQALRVLDEVDRLLHATVRESDALDGGKLEIAVGATLGASIMPSALVELRRRHPGLKVQMAILNDRRAIDDAVLHQGFDGGFRSGAGVRPGLDIVPVLADELVLIAPRGHALADRQAIAPGDLAGHAFVGHSGAATPDLFAQIQSWRLAGGAADESGIVFDDQDAILTAVLAGGGVSIVSGVMLNRTGIRSRLVTRPLSPPLTRDFFLVRRRRPRQLAALDVLTDIIRRIGEVPAIRESAATTR
jgi:DNA-binding transcriptional LysR family regulator